jgi:hypoxanthine phosphoribosyltransferase
MKKHLTWGDVSKYVEMVAETYKTASVTGVYGFPRGGLVLAVMISHKMGIPMLAAPAEGCLIVDDICDSGETLMHYYQNSSAIDKPKYHITTMMYKDGAMVTPGIYYGKKGDDWIVFPWEV